MYIFHVNWPILLLFPVGSPRELLYNIIQVGVIVSTVQSQDILLTKKIVRNLKRKIKEQKNLAQCRKSKIIIWVCALS